jgi:hypothetical protein
MGREERKNASAREIKEKAERKEYLEQVVARGNKLKTLVEYPEYEEYKKLQAERANILYKKMTEEIAGKDVNGNPIQVPPLESSLRIRIYNEFVTFLNLISTEIDKCNKAAKELTELLDSENAEPEPEERPGKELHEFNKA